MQKVTFLALALMVQLSLLFGQYAYYKHSRPEQDSLKKMFNSHIGLPDCALVNEAHYVRHRSLSTPFMLFSESPSLMEYFPSTFVYAPNTGFANLPSRIEDAR